MIRLMFLFQIVTLSANASISDTDLFHYATKYAIENMGQAGPSVVGVTRHRYSHPAGLVLFDVETGWVQSSDDLINPECKVIGVSPDDGSVTQTPYTCQPHRT